MRIDEAPIGSPCQADWSAMKGTGARRHCGDCKKSVHDLSAMSEGAARRLLQRSPGVCVRYTCRSDGTMVHRERRLGERLLPRFLALAGAVVAAAPAYGAPQLAEPQDPRPPTIPELLVQAVSRWVTGTPATPPAVDPGPVFMGDIAPPPRVLMGAPPPREPPQEIPNPPEPPKAPDSPAPKTIPELDAR